MQTPPKAPTSALRATSSVSYRGVILVLHSLLTLYSRPRVLNHGCPKGKKSGDPTVPASGIATGTTGRVRPTYWRAWPLLVFRESYQTTKVELLQGAHAR